MFLRLVLTRLNVQFFLCLLFYIPSEAKNTLIGFTVFFCIYCHINIYIKSFINQNYYPTGLDI